MSEPVTFSIKWCDAEKKDPDETDLIRMLDRVVSVYLAIDGQDTREETRRAVDWLQSKYGTKR